MEKAWSLLVFSVRGVTSPPGTLAGTHVHTHTGGAALTPVLPGFILDGGAGGLRAPTLL